jgi:hypothetical protein
MRVQKYFPEWCERLIALAGAGLHSRSMKTFLRDSDFSMALANVPGRERRPDSGSDTEVTGSDGELAMVSTERLFSAEHLFSTEQMMTLVASLGLRWGECGENPAVFCYRIGMDLMAPLCGHRSAQGDLP